MNKRKKVFGIILSAIMLLSVASVGTASAAVTKHPEKNGTWCYSLEPRKVTSQYYHTTKQHGSSARVGNGTIIRGCAKAGKWSFARAQGSGTRYAWWHSECNHTTY